jgi:O-methyltransferase
MSKIYFIRKSKALFLKWNLHVLFSPFVQPFLLLGYLTKLSKWRKKHALHSCNDFYSEFNYDKRYKLYEHVLATEVPVQPILYLEFGVAAGHSIKWWVENQKDPQSAFYGFDTFEGLPEDWGSFKQGDMTSGGKYPDIRDIRCTFVKGLFQDTLPGMLSKFNLESGRRKILHLDADLYSSTLFVLTTMAPYLKAGDILIFDEFNVPLHEFKALQDFESAYYIKYDVIASMNNYFHVALKLK